MKVFTPAEFAKNVAYFTQGTCGAGIVPIALLGDGSPALGSSGEVLFLEA